MRRSKCTVLVLAALFFVGIAQAQDRRHGLIFGGGVITSYQQTTGDVRYQGDRYDFNSTSGLTFVEGSPRWGFGWDDKFLYGFQPVIGYRFEKVFSLRAAYTWYLVKYGNTPDTTSGLNTDWQQSGISLTGQLYPLRREYLDQIYLIGGIEYDRFSLQRRIASGSEFKEIVDSEAGLGYVGGLGVDLELNQAFDLTLQVTYTFTPLKSDLYARSEEIDFDWQQHRFGIGMSMLLYLMSGERR